MPVRKYHVGLGIGFVVMHLSLGGPFAMAADQSQVERGAYLARMGDCTACHTSPDGQAFAGGAAIHSPFGPMYAPNITPDKTAGIGAWSDDEFYRAMHEGIRKDGARLYPAFPYQWFTNVSRDDVLALRAYLNTVPPVAVASKETKLSFPFDIRTGIIAWNLAYLHEGPFKPDPAKSEAINRGAYIVEGLGHCGDCHTPKGTALEPLTSRAFSGGEVDNWYAPNITPDKTRGIGAWSDEDLSTYLKTGSAPGKVAAAGPMAQVVRESLSYLSDADIHAIVAYLRDLKPIEDYKPVVGAKITSASDGRTIYLSRCAFCHQGDGTGRPGFIPALDGNAAVQAKGPDTVIRTILGGRLAHGDFAPMPAVGADMSDADIATVTTYVRSAWSNAAPAAATDDFVATIRKATGGLMAEHNEPGLSSDPCKLDEDGLPVQPLDDPQGAIAGGLAAVKSATIVSAVAQLVDKALATAPRAPPAQLANGLIQALCRAQVQSGSFGTPASRQLLGQFGQFVYADLVARGRK